MVSTEDSNKIRDLAYKYGFLDSIAADLFKQTTFTVWDMIHGEQYSGRTAARKTDLKYVSKHSRGLRLALGRLNARTQLLRSGKIRLGEPQVST
jgi:hypothetical protein